MNRRLVNKTELETLAIVQRSDPKAKCRASEKTNSPGYIDQKSRPEIFFTPAIKDPLTKGTAIIAVKIKR